MLGVRGEARKRVGGRVGAGSGRVAGIWSR